MDKEDRRPTLKWKDTATEDVLNILDYINAENPQAAEKTVEIINTRVGNLEDMPKMGRPGRVPGTRELVISPSYVAVYSENPDEVVVLRVLHASQQWPV
jgi:toxin ParE1/3/4|tara:strand:+ start:1318 stop:1614 length:297 start_codon:yes stop_codon:yes gene_type:complete